MGIKRVYNEIDPVKADTIRELIGMGLIPDGDVDERSITDFAPRDLEKVTQFHAFAGVAVWAYALRLAGWPDDRPVWTGSPPCQPWSKAGRRKGADDERHLWPMWFAHIGACRPPVVFLEQVSAEESIGSIQHEATGRIAHPSEWAWIDHVQFDLEAASYAVGHRSFPAACVGAPHARGRLYAVAYTSQAGLEGLEQYGDRESERSLGARSVATPAKCGPVGGFWADGARVAGTHGFDRFTEPGSVALVDGAARSVGCGADPSEPTQEARQARIEAYGDAIVAPQAQAFIEAAMEVIG